MKLRILILLLCFHGKSFCDAPPGDIDVVHYSFELELSDSTDAISGKSHVTISFAKAVSDFALDLHGKSQQGKGMTVSQVSINNRTMKFQHVNNRLVIALGNAATVGSVVTVDIEYAGIPEDGLIIGKNKFGDRTFFGDNWPNRAHHWLPVVDHPSDKASVEFIVTAPLHYEVIGNGVKQEESFIGRNKKLTHWKETVPLATKVMVIGAARFAISYPGKVNGIPIEQWVYPQNREDGFRDFASAGKILDFLIKQIGPYPYLKLANVQSKTRYGGMENASNIFYFENAVNGKADHVDLIAHEIAHQWFGNSATEASWEHVWLSEGFATYMTNVFNESTYGDEARAKSMKSQRDAVIKSNHEQPLPVVFNTLPNNLMNILNANSYQKGSWILHMLRRHMGDDAFWKGIQLYYKEYSGHNAVTADFQRVMQTQSNTPLDQFFRQWLYRPGHPVLSTSWKYAPSGGTIEIIVTQTQPGDAFVFPLEIRVSGAGGNDVQTVTVGEKMAKFTLKASFKPSEVVFDEHVNLLWEADKGK
jgi:aminopeptidase N